MRANGAVEGGAGGFAEGDEVIVLKKYDSSKVYVVGHTDGIRTCGLYFIYSNDLSVYSLDLYRSDGILRGLAKKTPCPDLSYPSSYRINGTHAFSLNLTTKMLTARSIKDGITVTSIDTSGTYPGDLSKWIAVKDGVVVLSSVLTEGLTVPQARHIYSAAGSPLTLGGAWHFSGSSEHPVSYDCYLTKYTLSGRSLTKQTTVSLPTTLRDKYPLPSPGSPEWYSLQTPIFMAPGNNYFSVGLSGKVQFYNYQQVWDYPDPDHPLHNFDGDIWEHWQPNDETQRWPVAYTYKADTMELVSALSGAESDSLHLTALVTGRLREYAVGNVVQVDMWNVLGYLDTFKAYRYSLADGVISEAFSLGSGWESSYEANNGRFMLRGDGLYMTHLSGDIFDQLHKLRIEGNSAIRDSSGDIVMDFEVQGGSFPKYFEGKDYSSR